MIDNDLYLLEPSAIIELFEIDLSKVGGGMYRFHAGTNELKQAVVWQGNTYTAMPIQASGFAISGQGQLPQPKLQVANVTNLLSGLVLDYNDLVGAKVTRRRTLRKYLDAVNFTNGNPDADATQELTPDVYYINRRSSETKYIVEFELAASFDVSGVKLPRRIIVANVCPWKYKGSECGWIPGAYYDSTDAPTTDPAKDQCGKRIASCKARFGANAVLPFGGFPGAGIVQS